MRVIIKSSSEAAAAHVAQRAIAFVRVASKPVLGLATGNTPLAVYRHFEAAYRAGQVRFRDVQSFNLDEYVGLDRSSRYSFAFYMDQHFVRKTDVLPENVHLPSGIANDPAAEAARYEELINECGGIGLQILSVGKNGHIGFNEPGANFSARTHVEKLAAETLEANRKYLPDNPPRYAITLGIATILEAQEIWLLATGGAKAPIVREFIEGPVSNACPASALQLHANTLVVLDRDAAAQLQFRQRYEPE
jgi:glucosamine-6-phosphate deaminase